MSHAEPDLALMSELLEHIERSPQAPEPHILLMHHYALCGWYEEAKEEARIALQIDSTAKAARTYLEDLSNGSLGQSIGEGSTKPARNTFKPKAKPKDTKTSREKSAGTWRPSLFPIVSAEAACQELEKGYVALLENAKLCLSEMNTLRSLHMTDCEDQISDLEALTHGRVSSVVMVKPLEGVRVVAEAIVAASTDGSGKGVDLAFKDLENLARWLKDSGDLAKGSVKGKGKSTGNDYQDGLRDALVQRVKALKALLPKDLHATADAAMMHAEHEILQHKYVNDETMAFDAVSDIPRATFWSSEDGYAWDMEELVRAITSGKGVMRNPLSKQMFTKTDIRAIIQHPLGKGLQALQVEQSKLKEGVRPQTVDELNTLANIILADNTEDRKPSHLALETFVSYLETLPSGEQQAIENLKVPAKDSHTGIAFDMTIGEAVKDVQGNRVCSHKAGDLLAQAVKYLR